MQLKNKFTRTPVGGRESALSKQQHHDHGDSAGKMSQPTPLPTDLDKCVQTLKSLSRNISSKPPKVATDLYIAVISLLCHLKVDQAVLQAHSRRSSCQEGISQTSVPIATEIPAITAVIQDAKLFNALLNCLKTTTTPRTFSSGNDADGQGGGSGSGNAAGSMLPPALAGRKRSYSVTSNDSDLHSVGVKSMKLSHSPSMGSRKLFQSKVQQSGGGQHHQGGDHKGKGNPTFKVQAVAATIIYIAFQHIDHWPAPLVNAYAEDCFGPRLWVNDERCRLLVQNLELSHRIKVQSKSNGDIKGDIAAGEYDSNAGQSAEVMADASKVAAAYREFLVANYDTTTGSTDDRCDNEQQGTGGNWAPRSPIPPKRRGSHSSIASFASAPGVHQLVKEKNANHKSKIKRDDGDSSSSGEEDEEVVVSTKSFGDDNKGTDSNSDKGLSSSPTKSSIRNHNALYPITPRRLNLLRVRQRYFGENLECAHEAIVSSLSDRFDAKAKQNSSLLQSLLSFTSLSPVRKLVAANLERWLQSPALSGLARKLFSSIVKQIKNVDPSLPADLDAIESILCMKLKANQLKDHIENVTALASGISTAAIANHIYLILLREILWSMDSNSDVSASDQLRMIGAVHAVLLPDLSSDGIAASLLTIMVDPSYNNNEANTPPALTVSSSSEISKRLKARLERTQLVMKLRSLIRIMASQLGASFDGCRLIESLLNYDVRSDTWSAKDEEDKARLMYQCVLLLVPSKSSYKSDIHGQRQQKGGRTNRVNASENSASSPDQLKKKLITSRKLLLTWCCNEYGPLCLDASATLTQQQPGGKKQRNGSKQQIAADTVGAGTPDYSSALGKQSENNKTINWIARARCILFMERADSRQMQSFIYPNANDSGIGIDTNDSEWQDLRYRIDTCCAQGADFDDEMMWIILKSSSSKDGEGIKSDVALSLLEHLFESCNKNRPNCSLKLSDTQLVWELYKLVEYDIPKKYQHVENHHSIDESSDEDQPMKDTSPSKNKVDRQNGVIDHATAQPPLPRLAYPGKWWRATILVIVMCGSSTKQIAPTIWNEHPTVQAMIKMVISGRYRFPTVDCDDETRDEVKKAEQAMREEESRVAEALFLPPPPKKEKEKKDEPSYGGSRVSARQREKREKLRKREQQKAAAKAAEAASRRKKQLRTAQKSIMIWDPKGSARKPPRESAELLLAVEELFGLSGIFQRSTSPDFVLKTIGETTRGAIERAYHWLIPIISQLPDTIFRLPPSTSCFLLLRAYGAEAEERKQLKELSAPLLRHVSDSLKGKFGQEDATRAFDLLMTDVASNNPDRRRSGRRVLQDAIGKFDESIGDSSNSQNSLGIPSWILNILHVEHAKWLVGVAIRHMSTAVFFERGRVLRSLLIGLEKIIVFAKDKNIDGDWDFAAVLIGLLSSRQSVCAEAMDAYPDLRSLSIQIVHKEFTKQIENPSQQNILDNDIAVTLRIRRKEITLPWSILQSACVLLSIWKDDDIDKSSEQATAAVNNLSSLLLSPNEDKNGANACNRNTDGFASARVEGSKKSAVSVESWVMLAKSRSDTIAKRAALTAPTGFLPRLLLCSGLNRVPLLTMIDRLGKMGEILDERDRVFNQLLAPSVTSEWDIGKVGHRRDVARKLLGRLSAYLRMNEIDFVKGDQEISTTFLQWLSDECKSHEKRKKGKSKTKAKVTKCLRSVTDASSILSKFSDAHLMHSHGEQNELAEETIEMTVFRPGQNHALETPQEEESTSDLIELYMKKNQPVALEKLLAEQVASNLRKKVPQIVKPTSKLNQDDRNPSVELHSLSHDEGVEFNTLAFCILKCYRSLRHLQDGLTRVVLAWVPSLSRARGSNDLWELLFSAQKDPFDEVWDNLISRCMAVWCPRHILTCRDWILSKSNQTESIAFCLDRMVRFLILESAQHSIQVERFVSNPCLNNDDDEWGKSEDFAKGVASIATECMKNSMKKLESDKCHVSRNHLPDWLVLLLMLAKCGAKQMKLVCQTVLEYFEQATDNESRRNVLLAVILRLYACNPNAMNLGIAKVRNALMEAAATHSDSWLQWRSPLDDQIQDKLVSLVDGANQRVLRPVSELSKKHPLLILRRIAFMTQCLENDATAGRLKAGKGVVDGQSLSGKLEANLGGKRVKVVVRHWGFSYTEPLWAAILDAIFAVPGPVLFRCGIKMSLLEFLNVYLRLLFVQSQLRRTERESRIRDKISELFNAFQTTNAPGWDVWLNSTMPELESFGAIRNILMCCNFITPEQARDHRQKTHGS